jgi:hypothetical protein
MERFGDYRAVECPQCGPFRISGTALATIEMNPDLGKGYLETARRQVRPGDTPFIKT